MDNQKIKILQVITLSSWGGAPQVVYELASGLPSEKYKVEIACGTGRGIEIMERLKEKGVLVHRIPWLKRNISPFDDLRALFALYLLIKKNKYDIVHCHTTKAGLLGRIAAKLAGVRRIYFTAHGWSFYNKHEYGWAQPLLIFLERLAAKCSRNVICVSKRNKEDAIQKKIAPESKLFLIRNGVAWKTNEDRVWARNKLQASPSEIVFGMTARLTYPKDPLFFLKAGRELAKKYKNIKFILIGDGPLLRECLDFVQTNKLKEHVIFFGEKSPDEARKLLFGMDIFVLISKFEGVPISIIEAMFAGLPVIATNVGGIGEAVVNNENGFLTDCDSLDKLIEKMELLIENPDLRRKMGEKGKEMAKTKFTLETMIQSYEKLYLSENATPRK